MRGVVLANVIRDRAHINKLAAEAIVKGLLVEKIFFQHDNSKPHIAKIVK